MSDKQTDSTTRGWNSRRAIKNPKPPAVPATLDLSLEEYYAAAGAIGLLSAQLDEPEAQWAAEWSLDFGEKMAAEARRRRELKSTD